VYYARPMDRKGRLNATCVAITFRPTAVAHFFTRGTIIVFLPLLKATITKKQKNIYFKTEKTKKKDMYT